MNAPMIMTYERIYKYGYLVELRKAFKELELEGQEALACIDKLTKEGRMIERDFMLWGILTQDADQAPAYVLEGIINRPQEDDFYTSCAVTCPQIPVRFLEEYAHSEHMYMRVAVVCNVNCPVHLLELLSNDPESAVRTHVMWNKATPIHVLEKLANDPCPHISKPVKQHLKLKAQAEARRKANAS